MVATGGWGGALSLDPPLLTLTRQRVPVLAWMVGAGGAVPENRPGS